MVRVTSYENECAWLGIVVRDCLVGVGVMFKVRAMVRVDHHMYTRSLYTDNRAQLWLGSGLEFRVRVRV